ALRLDRLGFTRGLRGQQVQVHHVSDEQKLLAFRRWDRGGPGDDVVIVANFSHEAKRDYILGFPGPGPWKLRFNSDWRGYSRLFEGHDSSDLVAEPAGHDGLPSRGQISVAPYSVLILSQDRK